jgi:osmotically-inducible protein OsmY
MNGPARYGLGPYHRRLLERRRPDDEVRHDVREALFYDTWVDADAISVEVRDGVVTLRGELPDHDEVRYATDDAWDVDGVRGVRTELTVNSARRKPLDGIDRGGLHRG